MMPAHNPITHRIASLDRGDGTIASTMIDRRSRRTDPRWALCRRDGGRRRGVHDHHGRSRPDHEAAGHREDRPARGRRPRGFRRPVPRCCELSSALTHPTSPASPTSVEIDFPIGEPGRSTWFWVGRSRRRQPARPARPRPAARAVAGPRRGPRGLPGTRCRPPARHRATPRSPRRSSCSARTGASGSSTSPWPSCSARRPGRTPPTCRRHVARYASPEQALGMEIDAKTDVYALSLSLIEAVTARSPSPATRRTRRWRCASAS